MRRMIITNILTSTSLDLHNPFTIYIQVLSLIITLFNSIAAPIKQFEPMVQFDNLHFGEIKLEFPILH